jgi:hypothetical protein
MGIFDMAVHADAEGLDTLQQLKGIGRREAGAEVAQALGARPHDERRWAELLVENDAVIAGIGLGQHRKFSGKPPIEPAAIDNHAADGDAVAADPFGGGVHHDIGAKFDRAAEIGRCEGIVDQQWNFCIVGDPRDVGDIKHFKAGIADGLADHQARIRFDRGGEFIECARLDERRGDAETRQRVRQQINGAAVK